MFSKGRANKNMKKENSAIKIVLSVIGVVAISICSFWAGFAVRSASVDEDAETLKYIYQMYQRYYYDSLEGDQVVDLFANSILDQYSEYYSKEEYELIVQTSQGYHKGIGISYNGSTNEVVSVNWNSPADRANIKEGGIVTGLRALEETEITPIISSVNGGDIDSLSKALLAMPEDVDFVLELDYNGEKVYYTLSRQDYTETFVRYYDNTGEYGFRSENGDMNLVLIGENTRYQLGDDLDVAVIDYNGFSGLQGGIWGSAGQMESVLSKFKASGKTQLILDLRDNGGGYMDIMSSVASHFINATEGQRVPICITRDKYAREEIAYSEAVDYLSYNFSDIVVLANDWTASASEALIGAMLDYDSSNIVKIILEESSSNNGVYRTYGKGIMQTTYPNIVRGDAIKLTTAKLFWPISDVSIHDIGVTTNLNSSIGYEKVFNETVQGAFYDALLLLK